MMECRPESRGFDMHRVLHALPAALWTLLAVGGLWLGTAGPVTAAPPDRLAANVVLLAEWQWWTDFKAWFSQQGANRSRVVQFGLVGMALALIIMYAAGQRKR